jgi:hypothetical protein
MDNAYDLAMTFLRVQEFYESSSNVFRGGKFTLVEFMDWYSKNISETETFTYTEDWAGFNVPGDTIANCYKVNTEWTPYDRVMLSVYSELSLLEGDHPFYVIGARIQDKDVINHELAHGLFYADIEYRNKMIAMVEQLSFKQRFYDALMDEFHYTYGVCIDEAQAYMATGLMPEISFARRKRKPFIQLFEETVGKLANPQIIMEKTVDLFAGQSSSQQSRCHIETNA